MARAKAATTTEKNIHIKRKRCALCRKYKSIKDFQVCKTGRYGRYNYCNPCHAAYQKALHPDRAVLDEKEARKNGLKKQGLKTCTSCHQVRALNDFYKDPRHVDGKQSVCKLCWASKTENRYYLWEYGLTPTDYQKMLDAQDGVCAICGRSPKKQKFNVDHCHVTHRIRALLCVNCNTNLLPIVERYPEWIKNAFVYLENPPAFAVLGERIVPPTNQARRKEQQKLLDKTSKMQ